ncbi:MAG: TerC family protein [Pyrinomonadaceae bacterium]|nr:TerC family protein [Pyrinomonadaceae bacterium]
MEFLADPQVWIAFITLTVLELVLGIDNVIFISILSNRVAEAKRAQARFIGLSLSLVMRVVLLFSLAWVMGLTTPLFTVAGYSISGRDLILLIGGLFLLAKSTHEIHGSLEGPEGDHGKTAVAGFASAVVQITLLNLVFSLDSIITAVGMVSTKPVAEGGLGEAAIWIMVAAVVVSIIAMIGLASSIGAFVHRHPTVKMLALSFLLMIGASLIAEGMHFHIPKGYIYFAMAFSVFVEMLNIRLRKKGPPVVLHSEFSEEDEGAARPAV